MNTPVKVVIVIAAIAAGVVAARSVLSPQALTQAPSTSASRSAVPPSAAGVAAPDRHAHSHAPPPKPTNLTQALTLLRRYQREIDKSLMAKTVAGVSDNADAIAQIAPAIGELALAQGSGVARSQVRDANILGKQLAEDAEKLHLAADANNAVPASAADLLKPIATAIDKLETLVPPQWACDMHCEACKVYDASGKCPVCRMALTKVADLPFGVAITAEPGIVQPGTPVKLTIRLLDQIGLPVKDLDIVHEQPLHLLGVASDLSWYMHEHPVRQANGDFEITQVFPHAGMFTLYTDFTPTGYGQQVPQAVISVAGTPPPPIKLVEDIEDVHTVGGAGAGGYEFRLRCNGQRFFAGTDSLLRFGISKDGKTVTDLEPYLGAMGHLVIISQDLKEFVHSHPLDGEPSGGSGHDHAAMMRNSPDAARHAAADALGNGTPHDVTFHAVFPKPGFYRAFAQFMHKGKVLTVPFTIDVQPGVGVGAPASAAQAPSHSESPSVSAPPKQP